MTDGPEYHKVVNLVLLRMDSHPEEFRGGGWTHYIKEIRDYASKEECAAIDDKFKIIMLDKLYESVCSRIFGVDEEQEDAKMKNLFGTQRHTTGIIPVAKTAQAEHAYMQAQHLQDAYKYQSMLNQNNMLAGSPLVTASNIASSTKDAENERFMSILEKMAERLKK